MAQPQRKAVVLLLEVLYRNRRVDPADVHRACRTFLAQKTRSLKAQLHVRNGVGAGGIGAAIPHARKENTLPAAHDDSVLLCHGLPHYLLDENERWCGKEIKVRVSIYNQDFKEVLDSTIVVFPEEKVSFLGDVSLNVEQTDVVMLYYKTDVMDAAGKVLARNWYFTNYETKQGCILESKRSKLSYSQNGRILILKNNDVIPAVGVTVEVPGKASSLLLSDNYFWMDPGEEKKIEINVDGIAVVKGWNVSIVNE